MVTDLQKMDLIWKYVQVEWAGVGNQMDLEDEKEEREDDRNF